MSARTTTDGQPAGFRQTCTVKWLGLPLYDIRFEPDDTDPRMPAIAKGVLAIGGRARGIFALGLEGSRGFSVRRVVSRSCFLRRSVDRRDHCRSRITGNTRCRRLRTGGCRRVWCARDCSVRNRSAGHRGCRRRSTGDRSKCRVSHAGLGRSCGRLFDRLRELLVSVWRARVHGDHHADDLRAVWIGVRSRVTTAPDVQADLRVIAKQLIDRTSLGTNALNGNGYG